MIKSTLVDYKTKILNDTILMEGCVTDAHTKVGSNCYIGRYCYLTKVTIGNYCSIANNVSIGQGEHNLEKISTSSVFYENSYEELTKKDCIIGNDVWLGVDVIVRRGVTIGDGAVVGANSVVTKDVAPFSVVVGSPARLIKYRFSEDKRNQIIDSRWWFYNQEDAKGIIEKIDV